MIWAFALVLVIGMAAVAWDHINRHQCTRGGQQHKFEPRYSTTRTPPGAGADLLQTLAWGAEAMTVYKNTHTHDVCVWCGKIAKVDANV